jgi:SAM-dependent methyltransferase
MDSRKAEPASIVDALQGWWRNQRTRQSFAATGGAFLKEVWGFLRESTPEQRRRRYGDVEYDWDHGVNTTSATVTWRDRLLGVFQSPYQPTEPALFREMLLALDIDFSGFTFVDLGSGKGRTLLMASSYSFGRIVGVELLPELNRIAEENLRIYKSDDQKCFALESLCSDARQFPFPNEPTVLYLFNPLPEAGLGVVIENLDRSLREHPRPFFALYHNPLLEQVLLGSAMLEKVGGTHQYSVFASSCNLRRQKVHDTSQ